MIILFFLTSNYNRKLQKLFMWITIPSTGVFWGLRVKVKRSNDHGTIFEVLGTIHTKHESYVFQMSKIKNSGRLTKNRVPKVM